MSTRSLGRLCLLCGLASGAALLVACGGDDAPSAGGGRIAVSAGALTLGPVTGATYTLTVSAGGHTVWSGSGLTSAQYGDGRGALGYVVPCDASAGDNDVTLTLESLEVDGRPLAPDAWQNPTPVTERAACHENADSAVRFDLVIMREADQGFFDVAVSFADVFCSAKLDCAEALLDNPTADPPGRDKTLVIGFACAAGKDQPTVLWLDDVTLTCADGTVTRVTPGGGPGNLGAEPPLVWQAATYRGHEAFSDIDKCYWNVALGVSEPALGAIAAAAPDVPPCVLSLAGTATDHPPDVGRPAIAAGTIYPIVTWSLPLTLDAGGELACANHPLDGADGVVRTSYSDGAARRFAHWVECHDPSDGHDTDHVTCDGTLAADGSSVTFSPGPDGLVVEAGGLVAGPYALPADTRLSTCCIDRCCTGP